LQRYVRNKYLKIAIKDIHEGKGLTERSELDGVEYINYSPITTDIGFSLLEPSNTVEEDTEPCSLLVGTPTTLESLPEFLELAMYLVMIDGVEVSRDSPGRVFAILKEHLYPLTLISLTLTLTLIAPEEEFKTREIEFQKFPGAQDLIEGNANIRHRRSRWVW